MGLVRKVTGIPLEVAQERPPQLWTSTSDHEDGAGPRTQGLRSPRGADLRIMGRDVGDTEQVESRRFQGSSE
jgi:hypothetical protein